MKRVLALAALVFVLAGAGCHAIDNDPILGKTPFRPAGVLEDL